MNEKSKIREMRNEIIYHNSLLEKAKKESEDLKDYPEKMDPFCWKQAAEDIDEIMGIFESLPNIDANHIAAVIYDTLGHPIGKAYLGHKHLRLCEEFFDKPIADIVPADDLGFADITFREIMSTERCWIKGSEVKAKTLFRIFVENWRHGIYCDIIEDLSKLVKMYTDLTDKRVAEISRNNRRIKQVWAQIKPRYTEKTAERPAFSLKEACEKTEGFSNKYSSFLLIGTSMKDFIEKLNDTSDPVAGRIAAAIDWQYAICNGTDGNGWCTFDICDVEPELIFDITKMMQTVGFADTAWGRECFCSAKNGCWYNGFSAVWRDGCPRLLRNEDEDEDKDGDMWDAFITVTDKETGITFPTGAGCVDDDTRSFYQKIVEKHKKGEETGNGSQN